MHLSFPEIPLVPYMMVFLHPSWMKFPPIFVLPEHMTIHLMDCWVGEFSRQILRKIPTMNIGGSLKSLWKMVNFQTSSSVCSWARLTRFKQCLTGPEITCLIILR